MSTTAISARDLFQAYHTGGLTTPVLRGVSFDVLPGECIFLAGPSGSGKTTLLSILGGVLSFDSGMLHIMGDDMASLDERERARFRRERVGILFQRFHLFRGMLAWENVAVAFQLLGRNGPQIRRDSLTLLESVGLSEKAYSPVTQLSVGQCQRVALARALAGEPELILADEPTASLDAHSGLAAMQLLRDLVDERGKTVVVVTHDSRIFHLADRILEMEDGQIRGGLLAPSREAVETARNVESWISKP